MKPTLLAIRDDTEQTVLKKQFSGAAGTRFSEALSGVSIAVSTTPNEQCDDDIAACETWAFSTASALVGQYDVEAFRNIVQPDGTMEEASGIVQVFVAPRSDGSSSLTALGSARASSALAGDGTIWTIDEAQLFDEFGLPAGADYSYEFARLADAGELRDIVSIASNDRDYGVALRSDSVVYHWGAAIETGSTETARARQFEALNALLRQEQSENGNSPVSVSIAKSADAFPGTLAAVLMNDGSVIAWYGNGESTNIDLFATVPSRIAGIDSAVAISITGSYLIALLDNGTVVELGRVTASSAGDTVVIDSPTPIAGLQNVVAIGGRTAVLADGRVFQWQATTTSTAVSTPVQVPGISSAVDMVDPRQNIAQLSDGNLVGWQVNAATGTPTAAFQIDLGMIGTPRAVSGSLIVDQACGRLWQTTLLDVQVDLTPASVRAVTGAPEIGFGGNSACNNGNLSRIVFFIHAGDGSGVITPPSGSIDCKTEDFGKLCWWFGSNDTSPVFTAVPDADSAVRDWRWDCASTSAESAPVSLRTGSSQNLCKITFVKAAEGPEPPRRDLTFTVTGMGAVAVDPAGASCGSNCFEYADGTDVTLSATPADGYVFVNWDDNGCTQNPSSAEITVSMTSNRDCVANFDQATGSIPPVARIAISPDSPVAPGTVVTFDGSASTDADGNILSWEWDLDGDLLVDDTGEIVNFTYQSSGNRTITLTVIDNDGLSSNATASVDVVGGLSGPPIALFAVTPAATQELGQTFTFDASASSDDIGIVSWQWDFDRDTLFDATGEITTLTPTATGEYLIYLLVTDTDGQVSSDSKLIDVVPVTGSATFALRVTLTGPGRVDVMPGTTTFPNDTCDGDDCFIGNIPAGTVITLDASALTSAAFLGWSTTECDRVPSPNRCVITMNGQRSVTVSFQ